MPTGNTTLLGLALPIQGELAGTWGTVVNTSITELIDSAVAGTTTLSTDADVTLTTTALAANQARQAVLLWTASNGATTRNITAPAQSKAYIVINAGTGAVVLRGVGPTTGVTIAVGEKCLAAWNGSDFVKVSSSVADGVTSVGGTGTVNGITLTGTVTSTGNLTLGGALTNVSLATQVTGTLPVANGGTGVTTSTGTGNVVLSTSPTLVTPALGTPASAVLTNATGLPISTGVDGLGTGVATFLATPSSANLAAAVTDETGSGSLVFATSPTLVTPALGTPSSATLTNATGLPIATGVSGLGTGVATFLATPSSANLATAVTDETGSGSLVFATSPTLVTPALGTPSAAVLTNATGLPISTGVSGLGTGVATALAVNVGTAGAPVVNGGVLGTPSSGTLTNATGLPISTGVSGLGTGVATFLATPSSANLRGALTDETGSGSAVFATSPTLVTPILGTPTSATLTNATGLPLTTGVTGVLPIANGGTGTTIPALVQGSGVTISGSWPNQTISATGSGGTVTAVTASSPLASTGGTTPVISISSSTGTGAVVLAGSPALTGVPTVPTAANGTNTTQIASTAYVLNSIAAISAGVTSFSAGTTGFTPSTGSFGNVTLAGTLNVSNGGTGATTLTGYVKGAGTAAMTASATIPNTDISGLGTMSTQAASAVAITGGTINNASIGATTASTGAFTTLTTSSTVTHNGGTANGVAYLNGSKVLTTGTALTFNGTSFGVGTTSPQSQLEVRSTSSGALVNALTLSNFVAAAAGTGVVLNFDPNGAGTNGRTASIQSVQELSGNYADLRFFTAPNDVPLERMKITYAGDVGIGTSSPAQKLDVVGNIKASGTGTFATGISGGTF
jgi:hypothetical protein